MNSGLKRHQGHQLEAITVIYTRADGSFDQAGSHGGGVSSGQICNAFGKLSQLEKYKTRKYKNTSNLYIQNESSYQLSLSLFTYVQYFICYFITDYIFPCK